MFPSGEAAQPVHCWADNLLWRAGLSFIPVLLGLTCIAGLISVWALFPSVLGELSPPRCLSEADRKTRDKELRALEKESEAVGNWLEYGYSFMRWAGRLIYLGILVFPIAIMMSGFFNRQQAYEFSATLGTIVAGGAVGILGFGGRFSKLALGFRPVVRVALDVDNWLREHPRDSNPTARICGRYVSLLRYIAQWEGEDHRGYDALIIVAHSQGTVITADLLRFLHAEAAVRGGEPEGKASYEKYDATLARLDGMPVYLFTVGCPLRQLYGLRFPYLYGYAPTEPHADILPKPEDLGVAKWVNAYRTGDYVGRYLWKPHLWQPAGPISFSSWDPPQSMPANIWTEGKRFEFSIGPGAHTHYWDSSAQPIAEALDVLIARAEVAGDVARQHATA